MKIGIIGVKRRLIEKHNDMEQNVTGLIVYQKSFKLAMDILEKSKGFPKEEKYSLTDQMRRSSRAVSANLAEAYCKRKYQAHFISKLSDADMENSETQVWLQYSLNCNYISLIEYKTYMETSREIGRLLDFMMKNPKRFLRQGNQ
jgi:four helix bundle protein